LDYITELLASPSTWIRFETWRFVGSLTCHKYSAPAVLQRIHANGLSLFSSKFHFFYCEPSIDVLSVRNAKTFFTWRYTHSLRSPNGRMASNKFSTRMCLIASRNSSHHPTRTSVDSLACSSETSPSTSPHSSALVVKLCDLGLSGIPVRMPTT
jgi:hypothetical protein